MMFSMTGGRCDVMLAWSLRQSTMALCLVSSLLLLQVPSRKKVDCEMRDDETS